MIMYMSTKHVTQRCTFIYNCSLQKGGSFRLVVLHEVKKQVTPFLTSVKAKDLAQCLVEAYYVLIGSTVPHMVVALTELAVTHYFKVKLPSTRGKADRRHLEVIWHNCVVLRSYPPEREDVLVPFVQFIHYVLQTCST